MQNVFGPTGVSKGPSSMQARMALAVSGAVRGFVFGVAPTDPVSFTVVPAALMLVAMIACWIPARRAGRSDPWTR